MVSGFAVYKIVVIICLISRSSAVRVGAFRTMGKDNVIFQGGQVFESLARSKVDCARRCSVRDDCVHFTWVNSSPGQCRGHSSCLDQSDFTAAPGAKTYTLTGKKYNSAWLNKNCMDNTECPTAHSECFKGECLCTPGYYYSISQDNCTAHCSNNQLQSSFLRYAGTDILSCTAFSSYPPTLSQCLEKCLCEPLCHSVDFGPFCCGHTGTTPIRRDVNEFDLYQRNCE